MGFNLYNTNKTINLKYELLSKWYPPDDGFIFPGDNNILFDKIHLFF